MYSEAFLTQMSVILSEIRYASYSLVSTKYLLRVDHIKHLEVAMHYFTP